MAGHGEVNRWFLSVFPVLQLLEIAPTSEKWRDIKISTGARWVGSGRAGWCLLQVLYHPCRQYCDEEADSCYDICSRRSKIYRTISFRHCVYNSIREGHPRLLVRIFRFFGKSGSWEIFLIIGLQILAFLWWIRKYIIVLAKLPFKFRRLEHW
jgi:hypothetical protein